MPVSTGAEHAKRCTHCEESGHKLENGSSFWRIHLDQDLLDTIIAIYPEWFKDSNVSTRAAAAAATSSMAEGGSARGGGGGTASPEPGPGPASKPGPPPSAEVDDSPLQKSMDKNKESLKVKLMLRRPINQLVAQGIMPPLKTPPAFHEQRQKLERAKMGDLLKAKIQQRPDRQELVRQHILEDVGHVDPSLAERQRMLKKARLADSLNDQLSHRPGPLELIKKNILHTEEPIERAVKEGVIPFKATSEGQVTKPQHPNRYITFEEDSQSSEGAQSPPQTLGAVAPAQRSQPDVLEAAAASAGIVTVALTIPRAGGPAVVTSAPPPPPLTASSPASAANEVPPAQSLIFADLCNNAVNASLAPAPSPMSLGSTTSSLSPLSSISVASPPAPPTPAPAVSITPRPAPQPSPIAASHRSDAPGKDKNRKKSKSKAQPKARTIKFHEYKGPPNAHKPPPSSASPVETSYELLLQQQQLFLQWQLEWQHKYPQIILPASQKPLPLSPEAASSPAPSALSGLIAVPSPSPASAAITSTSGAQHAAATAASVLASANAGPTAANPTQAAAPAAASANGSSQDPPPIPTFRTLMKLEDMKVSDLKAELKRRNLPVSGSKPQLIERLKPYCSDAASQQHVDSQNNQTATIPTSHMTHVIMDTQSSIVNEESLAGMSMETPVSPPSQQMSLNVESCVEDDLSLPNLSPKSEPQLSPLSQTMSPDAVPPDMDMDTSDCNLVSSSLSSPSQAPASPTQAQTPLSEEIIRDQQRKIEELQRELLRSQLQLHKIRCKELNLNVQAPQSVKCTTQHKFVTAGTTLNSVPNGIIINPDMSSKQHQKLILQQHIQQKKQQQHLQQQIQALQQQRQPQQQRTATPFQTQQQAQPVSPGQANQMCPSPQPSQPPPSQQPPQQLTQAVPHPAPQLQLEQSLCALQTPQPGLSAKASLAAFLQNQNQQNQQQLMNILQQNVVSNNKINCSMISNNKKNTAPKSIVLGQQSAVVLNQINLLQKQKSSAANGIVGHQRTSSLPNFFGSFLSHPQQQEQSSVQSLQSADSEKAPEDICDSTEPHLLITKPPPEYEEATKQLKVKQEVSCDSATKGGTRQKNVKSQMMDDVLEILIKNGELPPSAAQDPATPTTPGRSLPHGLIFTTSSVSTCTSSSTSTSAATSTDCSTSKSAPTTTTTTTSACTVPDSSTESSGSGSNSPSPPAPPPPPPPPPPLPHSSFSVTLPTSITLTSQPDTPQGNNPTHFPMQFSNAESFEFLLDNTESGRNHQSPSQEAHSGSVLSGELHPNPEDDLKELGLDLETLDSMDFGHFGDLCGPVKMPSSHMLETVTDMEIGGSGDAASENTLSVKIEEMPLHDQLMNHGNGRLGCELMEMGDMPMDMDDPDWLESLMHTDQNALHGSVESSSVMTPPHQNSFSIPASTGSSYHFTPNNVDLDSYDPLLSNSQDPFDLFNIEDPDFKMSADLNALGWDKVDFAT